MPLQPIILLLAGIGFFAHIEVLFIIGASIAIFLHVYGVISGRMDFWYPLIAYILGFIIGGWYGILWGAVIMSAVEILIIPVIGIIIGGTYSLFDKSESKNIDK